MYPAYYAKLRESPVLKALARRGMSVQERRVGGFLELQGVDYVYNRPMGVGRRFFIVDFFIPSSSFVLECLYTSARTKLYLEFLKMRVAYTEYKFRKLRGGEGGGYMFGLLAEAEMDPRRLRMEVADIIPSADVLFCSFEEFRFFFLGKKGGGI